MPDAGADRKGLFERTAAAFAQLRGLDPGSQRQRLTELATTDPECADEVQSLLTHADAGASFLDTPVVMAPEGMMVGRYRVERVIGEGGMGIVFEAQQVEPVQRTVALKLIKLGMDTRAIVRRFEAERQVLARMEHPGIARIFDGGIATDGRPYFVMELVRGEPITAWCETARIDIPARIRLFLGVCDAVQHAHQKGVLHRDLKPSNLLVARIDGKPVPKVIDFGIARALDDEQGERVTLNTVAAAVPLAGTPEYMSPEQAGLIDADRFDIRCDVYSLGVVLFELLSGVRPARARTRNGELRRPASLQPRLRGDLDAIIRKATAFDPAMRYATVAALAEDLERHLRHEPVRARPPGALYLTRQFARRHAIGLTAATAMLLALVAGLTLALWGMQRARDELFASTVERGRLAGVVGDLIEAREALWACYLERPDSPQAAWALRELSFRYPTVWALRRPGLRMSQVMSLDAQTLVISGSGGTPFTVDVESGAVRLICQEYPADGRKHNAQRIDVAPDASCVAVADNNGEVRLWSLADGRTAGTVAAHGPGASVARFVGSANELLTGGADGQVRLMHRDDSEPTRLLWSSASAVRSLAVHRESGRMAAGLTDGTVLLWQRVDEAPQRLKRHDGRVLSLEFDDSGLLLASGGTDRAVAVWSATDGALQQHVPTNNGTVRDLRFGADGSLYILGWWHLDRLRPGQVLPEQVVAEGGWRMALPREGEVVVSSSGDSVIRRWHMESSSLFAPLPMESGWRVRGVCGGDAPLLVAKGSALRGQGFDGEVLWTQTLSASPSSVAASADGACVAAGTSDGALWLRRSRDAVWDCVARDFAPGDADAISMNAQGTHVAYPRADNAVMLVAINAPEATPLPVLAPSKFEQLATRFSTDGAWLASVERNATLRMAELGTGRTLQHACGQTSFSIGAARDGSMILGTWTGPLQRATARDGVVSALRGHTAIVGTLAVHPVDPDLVLTGSMDGTVRLWHLGLGRELQSLSPFSGAPIGLVAFDTTGRRVVATSADGRAVSWPLYLADQFIRDNSPTPQAAGRDPLR